MARLIGSELRTGLLIGLVLALLAFPMVWLAFGELRLAAAVTIALAGASVLASVLGLLLPWSLAPDSAPTQPTAAGRWRRSCRTS
jgi:magnesium transporter